MKLFHYGKDGGPYSTVHGFFLVEIKSLFSVALLRFSHGSREAFHTHAFNCISWVLKGKLKEESFFGPIKNYVASIFPVITKRSTFHRVVSEGNSWVFTLRGPWVDRWIEFDMNTKRFTTLTHGRKEISDVDRR